MTQPLTTAEIRLAQYGERTSTWSTATYNDGTEKALHEIALGLKSEVDRLRAELAAARDRVVELEAFAYGCDGEGCVLPHSSWCERAKKTAAENNGCTCGQPWTGHPQPHAMHCWTVNLPRSDVEEMRRALAAMRTKTLTAEADEIVLHCPDHGPQDQDGVWMDCHCAVADDMRRRAAAVSTARP